MRRAGHFADLMACLVVGTMCLTVPLLWNLSAPTVDDTKRLAVAILGSALLLALALRPWRGSPPAAVWPPLALGGWLVLTSALGPWPGASVAALWPMLIGVAMFIAVQVIIPVPPARVAAWWLWLGVSGAVVGVLALWAPDWIVQVDSESPDRYRHAATFGNPESLAGFLAPICCLAAARLLAGNLGWGRGLILGGSLTLWIAAICTTASRGPTLALLIGLVAVWLLSRRRPSAKGALVGLTIMAAGVAGHFALGARSPIAPLTERLGHTLNIRYHSLHHRLTAWTLGAHMVWRSPAFGHGWGSYEFLFQDELRRRQREDPDGLWELEAGFMDGRIAHRAHCDYLEIAVAAGLPGLLLFLWILSEAVMVATAVPAASRHWTATGALGGVICFAALAAVSFPLQRPVHAALLWLMLGVCRRADQSPRR